MKVNLLFIHLLFILHQAITQYSSSKITKRQKTQKFRLPSPGKTPQGGKPNNPLSIVSSQNEISNPRPKTSSKVPIQPSSQVKVILLQTDQDVIKVFQTSVHLQKSDLGSVTNFRKTSVFRLCHRLQDISDFWPCHSTSENLHVWKVCYRILSSFLLFLELLFLRFSVYLSSSYCRDWTTSCSLPCLLWSRIPAFIYICPWGANSRTGWLDWEKADLNLWLTFID